MQNLKLCNEKINNCTACGTMEERYLFFLTEGKILELVDKQWWSGWFESSITLASF